MAYPPLVTYATADEYRAHFESLYCNGPITTFDGIEVRFRKSDFVHCFFESSRRNGVKDTFSVLRSERIDWIKATLEDPKAELYQGWDNVRRVIAPERRVAIVMGNYVAIISTYATKTGTIRASFVTAYVADTGSTLTKIRSGPRW